jgi:hypothetical protein
MEAIVVEFQRAEDASGRVDHNVDVIFEKDGGEDIVSVRKKNGAATVF